MNQLQLFNFKGIRVRTVLIDDEPYFVGKDSALAIGYKNFRDALSKHVKAKYKRESQIATPSGTQMMTVISEPGVYQLASQSKLPSAEPFQDWIYEDVLPSIRKNGAYVTSQTAEDWLKDPDMMIKVLKRYKSSREENDRLKEENATLQPKAIFADAVSVSHSTILVGDLAKLLRGNGFEIGANRLFKWLRTNGYLISGNRSDRNMPTQRSMELGLFKVKETSIAHSDGHTSISKTPKVTGKGQQYFVNKFLIMQKGIVD